MVKNPLLEQVPFFPSPAAGRPLLLSAPLAGISHAPLRRIWAELGGCDVYFSEMISAEAFVSVSPFRDYYLDDAGQGQRTVFQLVSPEPDTLCSAAAALIRRFDRQADQSGSRQALGIDINMGCSAPEIVRQGAGVEWMKKPEAVKGLLDRLRQVVSAGRYSLSVKMRLGEADDFPRLVEFCRTLETCGIDFITLHPRVRKDPWGRPARQARISSLARETRLPLVANGDLGTRQRIDQFLELWTAENRDLPCAGIMAGRGAVEYPWLFSQVKAGWAAGHSGTAGPDDLEPDQPEGNIHQDRLALARHFHDLLESLLPEQFWFSRAKRFYAWYCKPLMFGNRLASQIQSLPTYQRILPLYTETMATSPERFVRHNPGKN